MVRTLLASLIGVHAFQGPCAPGPPLRFLAPGDSAEATVTEHTAGLYSTPTADPQHGWALSPPTQPPPREPNSIPTTERCSTAEPPSCWMLWLRRSVLLLGYRAAAPALTDEYANDLAKARGHSGKDESGCPERIVAAVAPDHGGGHAAAGRSCAWWYPHAGRRPGLPADDEITPRPSAPTARSVCPTWSTCAISPRRRHGILGSLGLNVA